MKKFVFVSSFMLLAKVYGWSQGCTPLRSSTNITPDVVFKNAQSSNKYSLNISNRYFEASKTFRGTNFVTDTLVTNKIYNLSFSLSRLMNNGWSLDLTIPLSANSRRNSADHGGPKTPKHTTRSFGLGDIRFTVYKWLIDPSKKWNLQVGVGIKLPTGDFRYQDYFFRNDSTKVLAPVDPAIQLGDGGTGITAELNTFYSLTRTINIFFNGYYLLNPREQNGVSNLKGRNAAPTEILNNTTVISVPDQYNCRIGATVQFRYIIFNAGLRYEKLPAKDLIGGNKGFRRATSVTSIEPGFAYNIKKSFVFVYVGIPFKRNIIQNTENNMTPAGFANYIFSFGAQFKL
jgi:hypothetical protein